MTKGNFARTVTIKNECKSIRKWLFLTSKVSIFVYKGRLNNSLAYRVTEELELNMFQTLFRP